MRNTSLVGQRFGRITITAEPRLGSVIGRCDCGAEVRTKRARITTGHTQSCGCLKRTQQTNLRHGYCVNGTVRREYWSWHNAKRRCHEPAHAKFSSYGGRGIVMCDRWRDDFGAFIADMGPCPPGHTLDRRDNDGPYAPDNCRWASPQQQALNRRHGVYRNSPAWARAAEIRARYVPGSREHGTRAIAREIGVTHTVIRYILAHSD